MENTKISISHRVAIGFWHGICIFLLFLMMALFFGLFENFKLALFFILAPSLMAFAMGFMNKQNPIMRVYEFIFDHIVGRN